MRFSRTAPPIKYSDYSRYRKFTRRDFQQVCAYCFRHEDEAGGDAHFEQDHFKPKRLPDVDPADYFNLYWSCRECNSSQNKGGIWPSSNEFARGEMFCDPCDHDPVGVDYEETQAGSLRILTPAGEFTDRHLRLSVRPSLLNCRDWRRSIKETYSRELMLLRTELEKRRQRQGDDAHDRERQKCQELAHLVDAYTLFVEREPFMLCDPLPRISPEIVKGMTAGQ